MANVKTLQASEAKAMEKVEKCKATIERHKKQLEKKLEPLIKQGLDINNLKSYKWDAEGRGTDLYWPICEIETKQDNIKGAEKKLREAESILANWREKLTKELKKDNFLNNEVPEVIREFLENWKAKVKAYCIEAYPEFVKEKAAFEAAKDSAEAAYLKLDRRNRLFGSACKKFVSGYLKENGIQATHAMYPPLVQLMDTYYDENERLARLERELEESKKSKTVDLVNRVKNITGTITDASGLRVNARGNLDGFVVGLEGKANVKTIGAGGRNIQCFHFRTLVHEDK
ncbi:hypothetical protein D3C74_49110 [compost metagenome]